MMGFQRNALGEKLPTEIIQAEQKLQSLQAQKPRSKFKDQPIIQTVCQPYFSLTSKTSICKFVRIEISFWNLIKIGTYDIYKFIICTVVHAKHILYGHFVHLLLNTVIFGAYLNCFSSNLLILSPKKRADFGAADTENKSSYTPVTESFIFSGEQPVLMSRSDSTLR